MLVDMNELFSGFHIKPKTLKIAKGMRRRTVTDPSIDVAMRKASMADSDTPP